MIRKQFIAISMFCAAAIAGCKSVDVGNVMPPLVKQVTERGSDLTPQHMAVIWTDAVFTQPGKPPTRGFGGRIYLYDKNHQPIAAKGELTVFGYDDTQKPDTAKKVADRKFVFPAENFARHFSKTELGPSYSVWVPWDSVGSERKTISLLPVFRSANGHVVQSDHSINVLPGPTKEKRNQFAEHANVDQQSRTGVLTRPVTYQRAKSNDSRSGESNSSSGSPPSNPGIRTSTIKLSPNLKRQLQRSQSGALSIPRRPVANLPRTQRLPATVHRAPRDEEITRSDGGNSNQSTTRDNPATDRITNYRNEFVFGSPRRFAGAETRARNQARRAIQYQSMADRWDSPTSPSTRFAPSRHQAQGEQDGQPSHVDWTTQPRPAGPPYVPPSSPQWNERYESEASWSNGLESQR